MINNQESVREEWEKEFDEKFNSSNLTFPEIDKDLLKAFISHLLSQEKSLLLKEISKKIKGVFSKVVIKQCTRR